MAFFYDVKEHLSRQFSGDLFMCIAICRCAKMKVRGRQVGSYWLTLLTAMRMAVKLIVRGRRRTTLISRLGDGSLCLGIAAAKVRHSYGLCKDVAEVSGILKSQQLDSQ